MSTDLRSFTDFAVELAFDAGRLTLGYFQSGLRPEFKSDDSPVTVADRRAEELIRARIEDRFPSHSILGEEYGAKEVDGSSFRWVIDPIDGTKAFMRGVPLYAVLIGLEIDGESVVGAAYFPGLDEMISGASGQGCFWNGRPARVSQVGELRRGIVSSTDSSSFGRHGHAASWSRIQEACYHRAGWSDAYGHLLVATGRIELMLESPLKPWDCGPFPPILREAGGYFGDWAGNETIYATQVLSTTRTLLPQVLRLLNEDQAEYEALSH
ncbi:MAG: inositol monophosphatase family protein [Trueperaceae bacterium]